MYLQRKNQLYFQCQLSIAFELFSFLGIYFCGLFRGSILKKLKKSLRAFYDYLKAPDFSKNSKNFAILNNFFFSFKESNLFLMSIVNSFLDF